METTLIAPAEQAILAFEAEAPTPTPPPPAATTKPLPSIVIKYGEFWRDYLAAYQAFSRAAEKIRGKEVVFRGPGTESYSLLVPPAPDKPVEELHEKIFELLVRDAERKFAVPGSQLKIERSDIRELSAALIETFNPEELWRYLDNTYNSEAGQTASYLLASEALGSSRELSPYRDRRRQGEEEEEAKIVSGRLVLTVRVYGDFKYSYSGKETLGKFLAALKCVAIWGGVWNEADQEAFDAIQHKIYDERGNDARCLGKMDWWPLVTLVSYKEKVEFRVDQKLAEQVQIFLSTYPIKRNS